MPVSSCREAACGEFAVKRGYCREHWAERQAITHATNGRRLRETKRWRIVRNRVLQRDGYICRLCSRFGEYVDHINPAEEFPSLFWDEGNLQTLCASCHGKKTAAEVRARVY